MNVRQAIEEEIDRAKGTCSFGEPVIALDPKDVLIDQGKKTIYVTMRAIQAAFVPKS